jgi:hypothetical protein
MLRESKGLRYLWVEAPPEVPLSPFSSQYMLICSPVPRVEPPAEVPLARPGTLDTLLELEAFSGTSTGGTARGTARARSDPDLNRPFAIQLL